MLQQKLFSFIAAGRELLSRKAAEFMSPSGGKTLTSVPDEEPPFAIGDHVDEDTLTEHVKDLGETAGVETIRVLQDNHYDVIDERGVSPIEDTLHTLCSAALNICCAIVGKNRISYETQGMELKQKLNSKTHDERKEAYLQDKAEVIDRQLEKAEKPLRNQARFEGLLSNAKRSMNRCKIRRDHILKTVYNNMIPVKTWIEKHYWKIVFAMLFPEALGTLSTVEVMPENNLPLPLILPIVGGISVSLLYAGDICGALFARMRKTGLRVKTLIVPVAVIFFNLFIIMYIRYNTPEGAFILSLVNVAIVALVSFLSYLKHRRADYFDVADEYIRQEKKVAKYTDKIRNNQKKTEANRQAVYNKFNAQAERAVTEQEDGLNDQILANEKILKTFDAYARTQVFIPINAIYKTAIQAVRSNVISARQEHGLTPVFFTNTPIRPLYDPSGGGASGNPSSSKGGGIRKIASVITILVLMGLFSACGGAGGYDEQRSFEKSDYREVIYISDKSIATKDSVALPSFQDQLSYVFDMIDFEPYENPGTIAKDGYRVTLSEITNTSFPASYTVMVPPVNGSVFTLVKNHRIKGQKAFIDEVSTIMSHLYRPEGLPHSYVVECLCEALSTGEAAVHRPRSVFVVSDLLHHAPDFSFYQYGARLMDHYDDLAAKADAVCPAFTENGLSGVEITAVYLPGVRDDMISKASRNFWTQYVRERGGIIRFLPNLPGTHRETVGR